MTSVPVFSGLPVMPTASQMMRPWPFVGGNAQVTVVVVEAFNEASG